MDINSGWVALAGVVLGQLLILASGWLQRRWAKVDLRRERRPPTRPGMRPWTRSAIRPGVFGGSGGRGTG